MGGEEEGGKPVNRQSWREERAEAMRGTPKQLANDQAEVKNRMGRKPALRVAV